jgi:uncharacterized protein (TIGR02145 family)
MNPRYILVLLFIVVLIKLSSGCKKDNEALTDIDGNIYTELTIGTQIWMKENLKVTRYRNGDLIGTTDPSTLDILGESNPKYQWPCNDDESNVATYGRLYTWYTVTDSRNICPVGWHVPTDTEWSALTDYLTDNGYGFEGSGSDIAKSIAATSDWTSWVDEGSVGNDLASNNTSGFEALPGGYRTFDGLFIGFEENTYWWSATEDVGGKAWYRDIFYYNNSVDRQTALKEFGFYIRCIKD